jgi:hypothetical protein
MLHLVILTGYITESLRPRFINAEKTAEFPDKVRDVFMVKTDGTPQDLVEKVNEEFTVRYTLNGGMSLQFKQPILKLDNGLPSLYSMHVPRHMFSHITLEIKSDTEGKAEIPEPEFTGKVN